MKVFCPRFVICFWICAFLCLTAPRTQAATQITSNTDNEAWSVRNSATSQGKVLWFDQNDTVFLYDGTNTQQVQLKDASAAPGAIDNVVFSLGSGASAGQVIGAWRRGTDFGWVSMNGGTPVAVTATNPYNPANPMNPEGVAIADGCVFMALQASSGNTTLVKNVFRIDPVTGAGTLLTGDIPLTTGGGIPTDGAPRISTSDCQAAWVFDDGSGILQLQFYNGTNRLTVDTGGASALNSSFRGFQLSHGRLVYE